MIQGVLMVDNNDGTSTISVQLDDGEQGFVLPMSLDEYFGDLMQRPGALDLAEHYGEQVIHIPSEVEPQ